LTEWKSLGIIRQEGRAMDKQTAQRLVEAKVQAEIEGVYHRENRVTRKRAYLSDCEVNAGQSIKTPFGEVAIPEGAGRGDQGRVWIAFVDDDPQANWGPPCRCLILSDSSILAEIPATMPPSEKNPFRLEEIG
jgi:hypothetical protein